MHEFVRNKTSALRPGSKKARHPTVDKIGSFLDEMLLKNGHVIQRFVGKVLRDDGTKWRA